MAVKDASGATLKSYAYDGLHRRVQETASGTTTDLYYSDAWVEKGDINDIGEWRSENQ
ncbi:MAG: hypothetical protein NNA18_10435 [Nitrospira sp.]|nr:hypothetical protein [Nitrospira sp.]